MPETSAKRAGMALSLSGGGFRAALFHLGALRRLNEVGALTRVDTITLVSGGSIIAAHLGQRIQTWPAAGSVIPNWETDVAIPFRAFTSRNLRTLPILMRLLPWNLPRPSTAVQTLARLYAARLVSLKLAALRQHTPWLIADSAPPPTLPHPKWLDESRVKRALSESTKRTLFGRF